MDPKFETLRNRDNCSERRFGWQPVFSKRDHSGHTPNALTDRTFTIFIQVRPLKANRGENGDGLICAIYLS